MSNTDVKLNWLDHTHATDLTTGVTWGVPWHRGQLQRHEQLELLDKQGAAHPVQSWPTAYWPDGSVKWTAHAAQLVNDGSSAFSIRVKSQSSTQEKHSEDLQSEDQAKLEEGGVFVTEDEDSIVVNSNTLRCEIAKQGNVLIPTLSLKQPASKDKETELIASTESRQIAKDGKLKLIVKLTEAGEDAAGNTEVITKKLQYTGSIEQAYIENQGPLRAVVVIKGKHTIAGQQQKQQITDSNNQQLQLPEHRSEQTHTSLIPFIVRLTFYRDQATIGLKHTLFYDGDPDKHGISGVAISFDVPMQGELYNRHVRLAGDTGWFSEAAQGLMTHRLPDFMVDKYKAHMNGERVEWDEAHEGERRYRELVKDLAVWNDVKLVQLSPDSYKISKRTSSQAVWIRSLYGARSRGLMYVGSDNGGLAIALKNFWKLCPNSMEVRGLAEEKAEMLLWLWSPDAEAMDLRHYDTVTHVQSSYEGGEELRSTPYGIAHTSDCTLHLTSKTPSLAELEQLVNHAQYTPLLICQPERYGATRVFGRFSLPQGLAEKFTKSDAGTEFGVQQAAGASAGDIEQKVVELHAGHAALEATLESIWKFYKEEIEQRKWYGFWDYGDVMHSYDPVRHTWKYDIGGCAWQNTELIPNKWLWYSFLRTGDPELYYMAEAMTRHTSETDLYHFGPYQGLGTRHNVLHYGCGCKEARIGMATLHRFYYYLTADERIGEIMDEVKDSDYTTVGLDPMRAYFPKDEHPTHTRSGPDWSAFCANWLVQWERYESNHYLNKIKAGIQSLKEAPHRLLGGPTFGYDPDTGRLSYIGHENYDYHMIVCMGGPQVWIELADLLEDEEWADMIAELGEFYNLPPEEKSIRTQGAFVGKRWAIPMLSTLLMAYAAERTGNATLGKEAWGYLMNVTDHWQMDLVKLQQVPLLEYPYPINELQGISTNTASQWSVNAIMCGAYIGELLS